MTRAPLPTGIELEYESFGSHDDPTVLLVAGFTAQMTNWEIAFCRQISDQGRRVVRFDNRDSGLSTKLDDQPVDLMSVLEAASTGAPAPAVPYTLSDMAVDAVGLLDHLGVGRAHAVGSSMGGMIVQTMAIEHPDRLASVTSIMATVGDLAYGTPSDEAASVLLRPPPSERAAFVESAVDNRVWSSRRYFDADKARAMAAEAYDRSFYPDGGPRQLAAMYASGDRSAMLPGIAVPMLVIHGLDDTLIDPSGGRRTAELVPGAELLELADMGHDIPEPLWSVVIDAIVAHTARADAARERSTGARTVSEVGA